MGIAQSPEEENSKMVMQRTCALAWFVAALGYGFLTPCQASKATSLLMVGNTFSSSNNLEEMVAAMLEENGFYGDHVYAMEFRRPASQFKDDVQNEKIRSTIAERPWTWVVLQEQSQIPGFYETDGNDAFELSLESAFTMNEWIGNVHAETVLLMTWGQRHADPMNPDIFPNFPTMQQRLATGYTKMQTKLSTPERPVRIAPAGLAYQTVYDSDPNYFSKLYAMDGKHPSPDGSFLIACVLYGTLSGKDPRLLKFKPKGMTVDRQQYLQDVAGTTLTKFNKENDINRQFFDAESNKESEQREKKAYVPSNEDGTPPSRTSRHPWLVVSLMAAVLVVVSIGNKSSKQAATAESATYRQVPAQINIHANNNMELVDIASPQTAPV